MKKSRKLLSVLLAVVIALSAFAAVTVTAGAATSESGPFLTVNTDSNLFDSAKGEYNQDTKKVTVSYYFNSTKQLLNFQMVLNYDPSVLSVSSTQTAKNTFPAFGSAANCEANFGKSNYIKLCGSDISLWDGADYSKPFVQVEFDVKNTAATSTAVSLDVQYMNIATSKSGFMVEGTSESVADKSVVDKSVVSKNSVKATSKLTKSTYQGEGTEANLKVNATSNLFSKTSAEYNETTNQVTVSYYLNSDKKLLNFQLMLNFDPEILSVNKSQKAKNCLPAFGSAANCEVNLDKYSYVKLCGTDLYMWPDADYSKPFVQVVFDVNDIKACQNVVTDVYLDVQYMEIANVDPATDMVDSSTQEKAVYKSEVDSNVVAKNHLEAVSKITPSSYNPNPTSEPSTTTAQPTTVAPTTVAPTTVAPSGAYLTVNATSNIFTKAEAKYDENTNQVTVYYYFTSNKSILNFQAKLDFDSNVLSVNKSQKPKNCLPAFGTAANCQVNLDIKDYVKLCGTDLYMWSGADYSKPFLQVVFDVNDISAIAPTTTNLYLDLQYMQIANPDPDTDMVDESTQEAVVTNSIVFSDVVSKNNVKATTKLTPSTYDPNPTTQPVTQPSTACVHSYKVTSKVNPTCKAKGYSVYTCSKCGDKYNGDYVDMIPHEIKDSTKCSVCGKGIESTHNYASNTNESWKITQTGAKAIALTFSEKTVTERGKDFIYIYDKSGKQVGAYSGSELAKKTITVMGDVVTIKLVTNATVNGYGFDVTTLQKGIPGDVNLDGNVNVDDVTLLQKYIAESVTLSDLQLAVADVNVSGNVDIDDVTTIQKYIAEIIHVLG